VAAAYVTKSANCTINNCSVTNVLIAIVLAALSGAIVASLLGLVALRIRGLYLAVITLAYGFVAERSIFEIPSLTNGGAGQPAPRPNGFAGDHAYAYFCFIFLALVLFVDWRLLRSKVGRAILAIKHSEPVASTYGINVTNYKVLAFAMSGVFAGIAGALFAFHETNVVANNFNFQSALLWLLMVVVGGLGSRVGVVIGSAFFALFPFLIDKIGFISSWLTHHNRSPDYLTLVIGPALALLTIIRFPGGIAEQISPLTRWLGGKPFTMHPDTHGEAVATTGGLDEPAGDTLRDGDGTDETTEMPAGAATGLSTEGER
jgi:branched-chain amino acid transport system permease protein